MSISKLSPLKDPNVTLYGVFELLIISRFVISYVAVSVPLLILNVDPIPASTNEL